MGYLTKKITSNNYRLVYTDLNGSKGKIDFLHENMLNKNIINIFVTTNAMPSQKLKIVLPSQELKISILIYRLEQKLFWNFKKIIQTKAVFDRSRFFRVLTYVISTIMSFACTLQRPAHLSILLC